MISFPIGNYNLSPLITFLPIVTLAVIAVAVLVIGIRNKRMKSAIMTFAVIVAILIMLEVFVMPSFSGQSSTSSVTINVGKGYVEFDSSETGLVNVTASQITNVSVIHMDTGLLVMSKDHGLGGRVSQTVNHINIGAYRLANGKTAYVASNNLTNLVIDTTLGHYVVLAPEHNLTKFLTDFSTYVDAVPGY